MIIQIISFTANCRIYIYIKQSFLGNSVKVRAFLFYFVWLLSRLGFEQKCLCWNPVEVYNLWAIGVRIILFINVLDNVAKPWTDFQCSSRRSLLVKLCSCEDVKLWSCHFPATRPRWWSITLTIWLRLFQVSSDSVAFVSPLEVLEYFTDLDSQGC